jgi:hypothetical protein
MLRRLAPVLVMVVVAGCGSEPNTVNDDENYVVSYCTYGAVSQAQLDGCEAHVTIEAIDGRDTNAARYARGEEDACLADAGPFCRDR